MRKLIASIFVTLDGYMVGPNEDMSWVMQRFNDEMGRYAAGLMDSMDAILLGRVTYDIMTRVWPVMTEETSPGAEKMNATPKIIFSRTLDNAEWGSYDNARVVKDHVAEEITRLKQQPGKNMVIYGSATLVQSLTQQGLIDEYQLLVHPLILGAGKPLFKGMADGRPEGITLKLTRTDAFKNGVVVLYYQPERK